MTVNHKDGDRYNNNIENLEWLSLSENIRYGFENGQYGSQKKIKLTNSNNEEHIFRSLSKASEFLGRKSGYISGRILKNKVFLYSKNNEQFTYSLT